MATICSVVVRVVLQLHFERLSDRGTDNIYKPFMVYFMSHALNLSHKTMSSENVYLMNAKMARRLRKLDLRVILSCVPYMLLVILCIKIEGGLFSVLVYSPFHV